MYKQSQKEAIVSNQSTYHDRSIKTIDSTIPLITEEVNTSHTQHSSPLQQNLPSENQFACKDNDTFDDNVGVDTVSPHNQKQKNESDKNDNTHQNFNAFDMHSPQMPTFHTSTSSQFQPLSPPSDSEHNVDSTQSRSNRLFSDYGSNSVPMSMDPTATPSHPKGRILSELSGGSNIGRDEEEESSKTSSEQESLSSHAPSSPTDSQIAAAEANLIHPIGVAQIDIRNSLFNSTLSDAMETQPEGRDGLDIRDPQRTRSEEGEHTHGLVAAVERQLRREERVLDGLSKEEAELEERQRRREERIRAREEEMRRGGGMEAGEEVEEGKVEAEGEGEEAKKEEQTGGEREEELEGEVTESERAKREEEATVEGMKEGEMRLSERASGGGEGEEEGKEEGESQHEGA